jgi:hypothetical protein
MPTTLPLGEFTCPITFERVRPPHPIVKEEGGISYVVQGDYELAFQTVLRDAAGKPAALSGYTQGRSEIIDAEGDLIFEGRYYDTRTYQALTGDDALTPTGVGICDHWINGFGRGAFAGHAISLGVHLTREGAAPFHGQATGRID